MVERPAIQPEEGLRPADKVADRFDWPPGMPRQSAEEAKLAQTYWPPMEAGGDPAAAYANKVVGKPPDPFSDPALKAREVIEKEIAENEAMAKRVAERNKEATRLAQTPTPQPGLPQFKGIPDAPTTQLRSGFEAFKSPAIFLALMGSLASRKPLLGAMQAATGVMEGFQSGDKERVERERQIWSDQTTAAVKQNDLELSQYNAILANTKLTQTDKMAQITALATANRDEVTMAQIRSGDFGKLAQLYENRAQSAEKLTEAKVRSGEGQGLGEGAVEAAAQRYLKTGQLPPNIGRGVQGRSDAAAIQNRAAAMATEQGIDVAELPKRWQKFKASQIAIQRFESGKQGDVARSLNVAIDHLSTIDQLAKALKNGDLLLFNRISQTFAEQTGSAVPTNLDAAKAIVGPEIIKAIGIQGGGTGRDRLDAIEKWNRARSPEQLAGVTETIKKLLAGQVRGLRQQYIKSTGLPAKDFDEMMLPETLRQLEGSEARPAAAGAVPDGWSIKEVK